MSTETEQQTERRVRKIEERNEKQLFIKDEDGNVILNIDNRENLLEVNSKSGICKLNGSDLPRVNQVDIHMDALESRVILDLDVQNSNIALLIEGEVKWFKGADRELLLRGQKD